MDMSGYMWICVDRCGYVWICVDMCRYVWIYVDMCVGWVGLGCKSRKTTFYVFRLFTPLFRRLRLSRASKTIDIEEIYRFISKILNFMPSGSVLNRFCVFRSIFDRFSIDVQSIDLR